MKVGSNLFLQANNRMKRPRSYSLEAAPSKKQSSPLTPLLPSTCSCCINDTGTTVGRSLEKSLLMSCDFGSDPRISSGAVVVAMELPAADQPVLCAEAQPPQRTLFTNCKLYCSAGVSHEWMVVDGGVIEDIGSDAATLAGHQRTTTTIDHGGRLVLPGLHDAHIYVYETGHLAYTLSLESTQSISALQAALRTYVQDQPSSGDTIQGTHWDQDRLGALHTRQDIDAVESTRPCILFRAAGTYWWPTQQH